MAVLHEHISRNFNGAFALAMQLLDCRADAEDVVQDSVHSALRQSKIPQDNRQFKSWFYTIVRNKVIDLHRTKKRRPSSEFDEQNGGVYGSTEINHSSTPEQDLELTRTQWLVQRTMSRLTQEQREIVLLKDWHGFSYAEISQILSIESGTVMSRLHRARLAFRKIYQELCS